MVSRKLSWQMGHSRVVLISKRLRLCRLGAVELMKSEFNDFDLIVDH